MDKNQLQEKLVEILTSIQTAAGKASDFALEQLPDIAQSYVMYGRAVSSAFVVFGILLLIYSVWALVRAEYHSDMYWETSGVQERKHLRYHGQLTFTGWASLLFGVLFVFFNMSSFFLVWFAPKVWLLKEIASLLR